MQLVVQSGSEPGRTYDITASQKIRMGRQSGNDVVVPDEQVSRRHAEIEERNGGLVVTDLGSSNGTFVNGTRITSAQNLQSGDTVQVGTTVLKVVGSAPSNSAGDYDQGATQVGGFTPSAADYGYTPPAAPSAPAADYGQSGGYGQPSSGYGQSSSGYDQPGQGAGGYGGSPSYGGSGAGSSYDPAPNAHGGPPVGGSSAGGSSYGGGSSPSYDQGQGGYGGSGQGAGGYGGPSASGSSYDPAPNAYGSSPAGGSSYGGGSGSSYDQSGQGQGAGGYGQSSQNAYGQSAGSYDPASPSAGSYGGSSAAGSSYGGGYDPANPSAGGYSPPAAGQAGAYDANAYSQQGYNQGQAAYGGQQAYGQPGQYGQQGAYSPAAPVAAVKKGGLPLPLIIVGAVVVLVIIGALVFFLFLNKGATVGGDIPAPPNSTKLDISAADIAKINPDVNQTDISKVSYGIYTTTDSAASILTFYQNDLKGKGWTQDTTQSDTTGALFKKGDQSAGIAILPITSESQITGLNAAFPAISGKVKVGQTLVIVASGPSSVFKTTPGA